MDTTDISDDTVTIATEFKQNFDQVTPEELCYCSEDLLEEFQEPHRRAFWGLHLPPLNKVVTWVGENLHPQLQVNDQEPSEYHGTLVVRKVETTFS